MANSSSWPKNSPTRPPVTGLAAGLFCVTLATLLVEILDSRLLSVLAWYHLSFLAVSVAMLGMAAGAVLVFVAGPRAAPSRLAGATAAFAVSVAVSHLLNLAIPFPPVRAVLPPDIAALALSVAALTLPFVLSGIVVTMALTRTGAPIGLMYGADLLGAAVGCVAVVALLDVIDLTSAAFVAAAVGALGACCFARVTGRRLVVPVILTAVLASTAWLNARADHPLGVQYPKNRSLWSLLDTVTHSIWNSHSYVIVRHLEPSTAWMWGPGRQARPTPARVAWSMIDGEAGTPITEWNGDPAALSWVEYDVTSLPYRLRRGRVGVIGVGGGRDVLTAIEAGNPSVTGIEINRTFVDLLTGPFRRVAGIADHPGVRLVHDEARSYLTRSADRFDVLQMSLIDTWAATGAGAYTLTENGLYTREGWRVFLGSLTPTGVLSVSRWYAPGAISETTRLVSLGVASLLDAGVSTPADRLILASSGQVATLIVSRTPFSSDDAAAIERAASTYGFEIRISPWKDSADERLRRVVHSRTVEELTRVVADPNFDFTPPSDARPFFFNMLKLGASFRGVSVPQGGVIAGNLVATSTLLALLGIVVVLAAGIIVWPLAAKGRPDLPPALFWWSVAYFSQIGLGFMFVQIPMLQRFSVYLGHPTYTLSIILFLMILSAGVGSLLSDSVPIRGRGALTAMVFAIAGVIGVEALVLQTAIDHTIGWSLPGRTIVVALFVAPLAVALGMCFPAGMRLLGRHSEAATAWMWGVNGACGVLASTLAVIISLGWGIQANLVVAAILYALLALPITRLAAEG
jgi:hypothetical protein